VDPTIAPVTVITEGPSAVPIPMSNFSFNSPDVPLAPIPTTFTRATIISSQSSSIISLPITHSTLDASDSPVNDSAAFQQSDEKSDELDENHASDQATREEANWDDPSSDAWDNDSFFDENGSVASQMSGEPAVEKHAPGRTAKMRSEMASRTTGVSVRFLSNL